MATQDDSTSAAIYRAIPGHDGYRAGSDGSIWSCWKMRGGGYAGKPTFYRSDRWKQLKGAPRKEDGRVRYSLRVELGKYRRVYGSHLVLEAFVGSRPDGLECCHRDGNCLNDASENLRWDTSVSNKADMVRHGTKPRGETIGNSKLTADDVRDIRLAGGRLKPLAQKYGVTETLISYILNRKVWTHVA